MPVNIPAPRYFFNGVRILVGKAGYWIPVPNLSFTRVRGTSGFGQDNLVEQGSQKSSRELRISSPYRKTDTGGLVSVY